MVKACGLIAQCQEHGDGARSMERGSGPGAWASLSEQVCNTTDTCSARCPARGHVFTALAFKRWESLISHYPQAVWYSSETARSPAAPDRCALWPPRILLLTHPSPCSFPHGSVMSLFEACPIPDANLLLAEEAGGMPLPSRLSPPEVTDAGALLGSGRILGCAT